MAKDMKKSLPLSASVIVTSLFVGLAIGSSVVVPYFSVRGTTKVVPSFFVRLAMTVAFPSVEFVTA